MQTDKATVLFYDASGGYVHMAESIAPAVAKVLYHSHWANAFPKSRDALPGVGLDGVERVSDFFDALEHADVVVFPDVGNIGLQRWLVKQGYPVWGAGIGSLLEQDRWRLREVLKASGLPVTEAVLVHGLDNLREMLRETDDCYIKMSFWRGDCETFHHLSYFASQTWLDDMGVRLGPYQTEAEFIVEQPIDGHACEVGIDGFLVDGQLLTPALWGYEVKDAAYLGTTAAVPPRLLDCYDKLAPVFTEIGYRGPFCIEARCTEQDAYLIDFTARNGSPPSEAQSVLIENLADVMVQGAQGQPVVPVYAKPIAAQLVLCSQWGMEHALGLEIGRPEAVRIHGHCRLDGKDYAVSPAEIEEFGGAVGMGNTVEEAIADAFDAADSVSGYQVHFDTGALDKAIECIKEGETLDLPWGRLSATRAA